MSFSPGDPKNHKETRLRWLDPDSFCSHEQAVQVLQADEYQVVISAPVSLNRSTRVSLKVGNDSEPGTVISCCPDQELFVLVIQMLPSVHFPDHVAERDPGLLVVDDFLSEEQERLLLEEIEQEWGNPGSNTRATSN